MSEDANWPPTERPQPVPGLDLSLDAVLELLANQHRRFALYALADTGVTDLQSLLEDVVTLDAALREAAFRRDRYLELAVDLYHWHIPVLADVGAVECDHRHDLLRYRRHPTLESFLDCVRQDELPG